MAFRNLIDADCGQTNSLVKLTTHFTQDQGKLDDLRQTFHGTTFHPPQDGAVQTPDQLVQEFLQESMAAPQTFQMNTLLQEMREIENQNQALAPIVGPTVKETLNISGDLDTHESWANQYNQHYFNSELEYASLEHVWDQGTEDKTDKFELGFGPNWANEYFQREIEDHEQQENLQSTARAVADIGEQDSKFKYSKFMKFMNQIGNGEEVVETDTTAESERWAQEYASTAEENYDAQFWRKLQSEWLKMSSETGEESQHPWLNEFIDFYDPYKEYTFSENNPMLDVEDPLQIGKKRLEEGDLPSAVLCFEAAVQKDANNVEAWQLLGTTQAENEQDPQAIAALKRCLGLDPQNLAGLLTLAVSYANESLHGQSCGALVRWLRHHPSYGDLVPDDIPDSSGLASETQQARVRELFLRAVNRNPQNSDPDAQGCLGVLFYLAGDYDKAISCFETALKSRPNDSRLWNRLGATLANGGRPEEAVEVYRRALELQPGFVRARYNVGIICVNLGAHREAAEHFLTALNLQAKGRGPSANVVSTTQMSDTIWSTLQMCISLMDRQDLKPFVENRNLEKLNEAFNFNDGI